MSISRTILVSFVALAVAMLPLAGGFCLRQRRAWLHGEDRVGGLLQKGRAVREADAGLRLPCRVHG